MIDVRGLGLRRQGRWLLRDVSVSFKGGQIVGLLGPPEAGKSMLLKALAGLQPFESGHIDGIARQRVGFAFQNNALFDDLDVFDNVALPLRYQQVAPPALRERVLARLRDVELEGAAHNFPKELSGGMQKRLGVARATIAGPQLGLFDEPTAGLDPQTTARILRLLRQLTDQLQMATLVVSQDLPALLPLCDRVLFLHRGRALFFAPPRELATSTDQVVRQFVEGATEGPL